MHVKNIEEGVAFLLNELKELKKLARKELK
jgi:hypothetical protein